MEVKASAELVPEKAAEAYSSATPPAPEDPKAQRAREIFMERLREQEKTEGIRILAAKGFVPNEPGATDGYIINTGEAHNPKRDLRRMLSGVSGRQLKKFRKRMKAFVKRQPGGLVNDKPSG